MSEWAAPFSGRGTDRILYLRDVIHLRPDMKISSLDIRKQEFSRSFRGFDPDEVDAFLNLVSNQWQDLVDELRRAEDRVREQDLKLAHYMKVEEALEEALKTARTSSRQTLENAEKRASSLVQEAEDRALSITREAEEERHRIRRETTGFRVRQQEIVAKMRSFLMSEMELLSHYDREEGTSEHRLEGREVRSIDSAPPPQKAFHSSPAPQVEEESDEHEEETGFSEVHEADASAPEPEPEPEPEPTGSRFQLAMDDPEPFDEDEDEDDDDDEVEEADDDDDHAPAWTVHDMVAPDDDHVESEDAGDEIRKIRRILDAMDDETDA